MIHEEANTSKVPVLWYVPQTLHARGLDADVGVGAARDCAVDDGLLLFVQQLDQPHLGTDIALDPPFSVRDEADDDSLFGWRRNGKRGAKKRFVCQLKSRYPDTL